jgi:hypothetical protein
MGASGDDISCVAGNPGATADIRLQERHVRNKTIALAALLCVPAAWALIANAPVSAANVHLLAGCAGNQVPANVVRGAGQAGDNHAAC